MLTQRERRRNESAFSTLSSTPQQEDFTPPLWCAAVHAPKESERAKRGVVSGKDKGNGCS